MGDGVFVRLGCGVGAVITSPPIPQDEDKLHVR